MAKKKDSQKSTKGKDKKKSTSKKSSKKEAKSTSKPSKKDAKKSSSKSSSTKKSKTKATKKETSKESSGGDALQHVFIPPHRKLSDSEKKEVQEKFRVSTREMPKIYINDPAIAHMSIKEGDVIEITRTSRTAGKIKFYRSVVRD